MAEGSSKDSNGHEGVEKFRQARRQQSIKDASDAEIVQDPPTQPVAKEEAAEAKGQARRESIIKAVLAAFAAEGSDVRAIRDDKPLTPEQDRAFSELLQNPATRERVIEEATGFVQSNFTNDERRLSEYLELLGELVQERPSIKQEAETKFNPPPSAEPAAGPPKAAEALPNKKQQDKLLKALLVPEKEVPKVLSGEVPADDLTPEKRAEAEAVLIGPDGKDKVLGIVSFIKGESKRQEYSAQAELLRRAVEEKTKAATIERAEQQVVDANIAAARAAEGMLEAAPEPGSAGSVTTQDVRLQMVANGVVPPETSMEAALANARRLKSKGKIKRSKAETREEAGETPEGGDAVPEPAAQAEKAPDSAPHSRSAEKAYLELAALVKKVGVEPEDLNAEDWKEANAALDRVKELAGLRAIEQDEKKVAKFDEQIRQATARLVSKKMRESIEKAAQAARAAKEAADVKGTVQTLGQPTPAAEPAAEIKPPTAPEGRESQKQRLEAVNETFQRLQTNPQFKLPGGDVHRMNDLEHAHVNAVRDGHEQEAERTLSEMEKLIGELEAKAEAAREYERYRDVVKTTLAGTDFRGEEDPIAVAEVYAAYGRYEQAIAILAEAVVKFGNRPPADSERPAVDYFARQAMGEDSLHDAYAESLEPLPTTPDGTQDWRERWKGKLRDVITGTKERVYAVGEKAARGMRYCMNRVSELEIKAARLFPRRKTLKERLEALETDEKARGIEGEKSGAHAPEAGVAGPPAPESAEGSSRFQKAKDFLKDRWDALGEHKLQKGFENLGDWYNKRALISKITLGVALTVGMGLTLPTSATAASFYGLAIAFQRVAGFSGTSQQLGRLLEGIYKKEKTGKLYESKIVQWLAGGSDERRKAVALVGTTASLLAISGATGFAAHKIGQWYGEYLKGESSTPASPPKPEVPQPPVAQAEGEIPPIVRITPILPPPTAPTGVEAAVPLEPPAPEVAAPTAVAEAPNPAPPAAPPEAVAAAVEVKPAAPEVAVPAAAAETPAPAGAVSGAVVEAKAGQGSEWMMKQLVGQLQKEGISASQYPEGSDMHKLLSADEKSINTVIHRLATEGGLFKKDTGESILIKLGDKLSFKEDGSLSFINAKGEEFTAATRTFTAPYTPEIPPASGPVEELGLLTERPLQASAPSEYAFDATGAKPPEQTPSGKGPFQMSPALEPFTAPPESPAAPPPEQPKQPSLTWQSQVEGEEKSVTVTDSSGNPLRSGFSEQAPGTNAFGIEVSETAPHLYANSKNELLIYGGSPQARANTLLEYLKQNPGKVVYGSDANGAYRIPYTLGPDGKLTAGYPSRTGGLLGFFSNWMKPPNPDEFKTRIK